MRSDSHRSTSSRSCPATNWEPTDANHACSPFASQETTAGSLRRKGCIGSRLTSTSCGYGLPCEGFSALLGRSRTALHTHDFLPWRNRTASPEQPRRKVP